MDDLDICVAAKQDERLRLSTPQKAPSSSSSFVKVDRMAGRRLPCGAELHPMGVHFRVWAPSSRRVHVRFPASSREIEFRDDWNSLELEGEPGGYFSANVPGLRAGTPYLFDLDNGRFPDPVSRFQPAGPHGPSVVIDPTSFEWTDQEWRGISREGQVIYEMHIGTFTREGNWSAAALQLPALADLGVTLLEVMPVADFSGRRGWGYDGVNLYAPTRLYGHPDDFRKFVNTAHSAGLGVILDVVYNHLGPDGNFLGQFSSTYFTSRYKCDWGDALNFDGEGSAPVREYFIGNAGYWIDEFHLDGLRLDATQQIFDSSANHAIADIVRQARAKGGRRTIYVVGENEPQQARLVRSFSRGGQGLDSLWNDDFHHSAIVALTGRNEAYYTDYKGMPQEFISCAKHGFLYQGQRYKWQSQRRGTPALDLHPSNFVAFMQNHDQVANSLWGRRIHTLASGGALRSMTALLLLGPNTPMLFQGQEFAASSPFLYFADHNPELAAAVAEGRTKFLAQFPSIATPDASALLADPQLESTFDRCKLNFEEREAHSEIYQLHRDLIQLRRGDPLISHAQPGSYDGAVLGTSALVLRYFGRDQDDRMLLVNLGADLQFDPAPEPLLAPPEETEWQLVWSSEDPKYGGGGTPPIESEQNWHLLAHGAALLIPRVMASRHE